MNQETDIDKEYKIVLHKFHERILSGLYLKVYIIPQTLLSQSAL